MRIALISFEYPPSVAIGGIGSYAYETVNMLRHAGHDVEVFAAGSDTERLSSADLPKVHRVAARDRHEFRESVLSLFGERHAIDPFDVIESPEVGAEGLRIAQAYPDLPLVVKLHTPTYLIDRLTYEPPSLLQQARFTIGALRRGRWAHLHRPPYLPEQDIEASIVKRAQRVAAPCTAIAQLVGSEWGLPKATVQIFPLPYRPTSALTSLPYPDACRVVGYLGRLEPRKGLIELTRAMPGILAVNRHLRFRMLGPSWPYEGTDFKSWMLKTLGRWSKYVDFVGTVAKESLPLELSKCDVMVLPSRWENFPYACMESLASGRMVIASHAGGMADMIRHGVDGLLVPPYEPDAIAKAVLQTASDPAGLRRMARSGRSRIVEMLNPESVCKAHLTCYQAAIAAMESHGASASQQGGYT